MVEPPVNAQGDALVRVRGGASLPSKVAHRLNASWPLGLLVASSEGITISAALFRDSWTARWADVALAKVATRSLVLIPRTGRGARFVTMTHSQLRSIVERFEQHGVAIEEVESTWRAAWTL